MINRLESQDEFPDLRKNLKVALINVAELPEGFLKICHELADKVEILDEIFGARSVKALHQLLPRLSLYESPPEIRGTELEIHLEDYRRYMKAMAMIFKKYKEEAARVARDETINFSEKIAPFLNPDLMLQKQALICLHETEIDRHNCHVLGKFLQEYGEIELECQQAQGVTTILAEL